jgi:hypothetical protein
LAASVPGQQGGQPVLAPPVSSIRWEMIREGVEDYEFLYQLRERLQQKGAELDAETARRFSGLLEVPPAVTTSLTEFATDPAPLYEHRRKTAQALERLGR